MARTPLKFLLMYGYILVTQMTTGVQGTITLAPLNRVVYEGSTNTKIICESNSDKVIWQLMPFAFTGSYDIAIIVLGGEVDPSFRGSFAFDHSQGTEDYSLVIVNATISPSPIVSTAGYYMCSDKDNYILAHLVVIRSDPICSSNFTQSTLLKWGDVIQLSCAIVYGSTRNWPIDAVMTWSVNGQQIPAGNSTFTIDSTPSEVTASSTLVIKENFDATYECGTKFSKPTDLDQRYASNAPDYFQTCTILLSSHQTRCSFPFTYNGRINYKCTQSDTNSYEVGCFSDKGVWITCPPSQLNYIAQNVTINIPVPTFDIPTQVISVDNWIVVQQRIDNSTDFRRNWSEYRHGFGVYNVNYWMGLEKIHQLTTSSQQKLRIEVYYPTLQQWRSAEYSSFVIDAEANNYALHVSGFSGDADNGLQWTADSTKVHDGMQFSTPDVDNDKDPKRHCANIFSSGWWFNACNYVNLNGHIEAPTSAHNYFEYYISGTKTAITMSRMMIHSV